MTIRYQGKKVETDAATVAAFLDAQGGAKDAVVEYRGEVLADAALNATLLEDGAELNTYRIVSGG